MDIEILISIRSGHDDTAIKGQGDILVVKPSPAPWGAEEIKKQFVVRLGQASIDAMADGAIKSLVQAMQARFTAGDSMLVMPSAQYAEKADGTRRMVRRSRLYINFNLVDPSLKPLFLNEDQPVPVFETTLSRLNAVLASRPNPTIEVDETLINAENEL